MNPARGTPRRRFLRTTAFTAVSALSFPSVTLAGSPSKKVRLGFIGCGGRARQLMPMFVSHPDVEVVAISDVIEPRMEAAMEDLSELARPQRPERLFDYRRMLERKDVDAVVIATTQHWHGLPHIHACQAGKPIFVEKPLSHTVLEGRKMLAAARDSGVKVMMGTQQRAGPHYREAVELIRDGRLGKVALVECWNYHNTGARTGRRADTDPPRGYHWDEWLGPAPWAAFNWGRLDSSWWFDYGGGMLTNWAVHHIDIILWAMNVWSPGKVACSGGKMIVDDLADTPDCIEASWVFDGWLMQYRYRGFNNFHAVQNRPNHHGIAFHGERATMVLDRLGFSVWDEDQGGQPAMERSAHPYFNRQDPMKSEQDGPWQRIFIECVQEKQVVPLDLEESHRATACCHLANIAYRTGRTLTWDGNREEIRDDAEAAALLDRPRRPGYELPSGN